MDSYVQNQDTILQNANAPEEIQCDATFFSKADRHHPAPSA